MRLGRTQKVETEEDQLRVTYRNELRQLAAQRFPYGIGLFLLMNTVACFLEQRFFPERGVTPLSGSLPYALIGALTFLIFTFAPRVTMIAIGVAQNLVIAIVCFYYGQHHGDATLLTASLLLLMVGFAVFFPCTLRQYLFACTWVAVGYPCALGFIPNPVIVFGGNASVSSGVVLGGAISTIPIAYNVLLLFSGACTLAIGVSLLDHHRFTAYCQTLRAQRADAAKSEFLATVSHELRTPLNIIIGYSSILLEEGADDTLSQPRPIWRIHAQSLELLHLIQNMLDLNRLEAGDVTLTVEKFSFVELLESLRDSLPVNWIKSAVEIQWSLPQTQILLRSDRRKLEVAMRNLIHNALKFTERGSVKISAGLQTDHVAYFRVADTGPGIAQEDYRRIFERFQQSRDGGRSGGVGIGLHIVKRFIEALGGTVQMESQIGAGACFTLTFPLTPQMPQVKEE